MIREIILDDGKYKWVLHGDYSSEVLRHGEQWRDTTGDNFVFAMAQRIVNLEEELQKVYEVLDQFPVDLDELFGVQIDG